MKKPRPDDNRRWREQLILELAALQKEQHSLELELRRLTTPKPVSSEPSTQS
ncbi:MAG: hypothetical protein JZU59_16130 [Chromatium okenii]|jgi:hypothetical protein|nr:hypothetical protein [Chromatium okenii]